MLNFLLPPMHALVCAGRFIILRRLWKYVRQQNTCHGVAPSRRDLIAEALQSIPETIDLNTLAKLTRPLLGTVKNQQTFLRKFRQEWGGSAATNLPSSPGEGRVWPRSQMFRFRFCSVRPSFRCLFSEPVLGAMPSLKIHDILISWLQGTHFEGPIFEPF